MARSWWPALRGLWLLLTLGVLALGFWSQVERWWSPLEALPQAPPLPEDWSLPALSPGPSRGALASIPQTTPEATFLPPPPVNRPLPTPGNDGETVWVTYTTQSGDTLPALAARFGVDPEQLQTQARLPTQGFLPPGKEVRIPYRPIETTSQELLFPDSEVVNSPSAVGFDIQAFVEQTGGYLARYRQYLPSPGELTGAQVVRFVAKNYSINPRLLLALLEFQAGWVLGEPRDEQARLYPLGYRESPNPEDLYRQLSWAAEQLSEGYYGWRAGRLTQLVFPNGERLALAPTLNAGTVALMYYFAQHYNRAQWEQVLSPENPSGFLAFYTAWFDNPWHRARRVEPLYPPDLRQPRLILPFARGAAWFFTSGPHPAYGEAGPWAALDFAPLGGVGCYPSRAWILAAAPGLVVRSERGVVVLDLDGDGYEETGWVLFYLHVATQDRAPQGAFLQRGDLLGHPSCEGGMATGTHVHIARRYNGEWMDAAGPVPFNLGGWVLHGGERMREGYLQRGDQVVQALEYGGPKARIVRTSTDP